MDNKEASVRTKLYAAQWNLVSEAIKKWVEHAEKNGFEDSIMIGMPISVRIQKKIEKEKRNEYTLDFTSNDMKIIYGAIGDYAMYYEESPINKLLTIADILDWNHEWKFKKRLDHFITIVSSKKWKEIRAKNDQ